LLNAIEKEMKTENERNERKVLKILFTLHNTNEEKTYKIFGG
jgi:hypothetical protein